MCMPVCCRDTVKTMIVTILDQHDGFTQGLVESLDEEMDLVPDSYCVPQICRPETGDPSFPTQKP